MGAGPSAGGAWRGRAGSARLETGTCSCHPRLSSHREVSTESLIDGLWGEEPPATARKAVHVHVSTLRRALGENGPLLTSPRGYVLQSAGTTVDAVEFAAIIKTAPALCRTSPATATDQLGAALGMWRGPCFGDLQGESVLAPEVARLDEILEIAVASNEGRVFKHTGDGVLAVFRSGADAANAGVAAIETMNATQWPTLTALSARLSSKASGDSASIR